MFRRQGEEPVEAADVSDPRAEFWQRILLGQRAENLLQLASPRCSMRREAEGFYTIPLAYGWQSVGTAANDLCQGIRNR